MSDQSFHTHVDERGILVKCYHKTKTAVCDWGFWFGVTVSFPLEHFIWEKLPVFKDITHWLGL